MRSNRGRGALLGVAGVAFWAALTAGPMPDADAATSGRSEGGRITWDCEAGAVTAVHYNTAGLEPRDMIRLGLDDEPPMGNVTPDFTRDGFALPKPERHAKIIRVGVDSAEVVDQVVATCVGQTVAGTTVVRSDAAVAPTGPAPARLDAVQQQVNADGKCQTCIDKNGPGKGPGFWFNPEFTCNADGSGAGEHEVRFDNTKGRQAVLATVNGVTKTVAPGKVVSFKIPFGPNDKVIRVTYGAVLAGSLRTVIKTQSIDLPCPCEAKTPATTSPPATLPTVGTSPGSPTVPGSGPAPGASTTAARVPLAFQGGELVATGADTLTLALGAVALLAAGTGVLLLLQGTRPTRGRS